MSEEQKRASRPTFPFYPFCLALFPILSIYSTNYDLVMPNRIWRPMLWAVVGMGIFVLFGSALFRNVHRAALMATAAGLTVIVLGMTSASVNETPGPGLSLFVFSPLALLASLALSRIWKSPRARLWSIAGAFLPMFMALYQLGDGRLDFQQMLQLGWVGWTFAAMVGASLLRFPYEKPTPILNVIGLFLILVPTASIVWTAFRVSKGTPAMVLPVLRHGTSVVHDKPDIYYIILDGYGRSDALKARYGLDNSDFIQGLRKRGFFVADKAKSNYIITFESLSSTLNMDYHTSKINPLDLKNMAPYNAAMRNNQVSQLLLEQGYRRVSVMSIPEFLNPPRSDQVLADREDLSMIEHLLLTKSPFILQFAHLQSGKRVQERVSYVFDHLPKAKATDDPHFVFAHVLAPHPPFVFTETGEIPQARTTIVDGMPTFVEGGSKEEFRQLYVAQAKYVQKRILETIDAILQKAGSKRPIIILQGDHGPRLDLDLKSLADSDVSESFPILNALLVPDAIREKLYASESPVNTFRILLSSLFGYSLPKLPDRCIYTTLAEPYVYQEVDPESVEKGVAATPLGGER